MVRGNSRLKQKELRNIRTKKNREFISGYLKIHHCIDCGESNPIVLEFDHINNKSHKISDMIRKILFNFYNRRNKEVCDSLC